MLSRPIVFDGRNIHDPKEVSQFGIEYYSIGRRDFLRAENGRFQAALNGTKTQKNPVPENALEPVTRS